jgi:hypothetical protein
MPIPQHFGVVTPYIVVKNPDSYVRLLKDGSVE